jgi:hypothetical protein
VQTGNRDLAENFTTLEASKPATWSASPADGSGIERCRQPRDPLVLGVVSSGPGLLLGADPARTSGSPASSPSPWPAACPAR